MGDAADLLDELIIRMLYEPESDEYEAHIEEEYERKGNRIKWETQDDRKITVREMSDTHLYNAKRLVERLPYTSIWIDIFEKEIKRREFLSI